MRVINGVMHPLLVCVYLDLIKREEQRVNAIMKKMTALEDEREVSASFLGEISGAQSKEIQGTLSACVGTPLMTILRLDRL